MTEIVYLDPEIANEGEPATDWHPGNGPAPIPDMAKLLGSHKHFGKYFAPRVFLPFPAWIYHKTEPDRIVKTAKEAKEYGVSYVKDENGGNGHYVSTGEWKTYAIQKKKSTEGAGKNVITSERAQGGASLEVMTQILQQMQKGNAAPPVLNDAVKADPDYEAFLEFKKWKAQATPVVENPVILSDAEQKEILVGLAKEREIHVDKRWSLERLKAELDKAA